MRKWLWILPMLTLAGCSRSHPDATTAQAATLPPAAVETVIPTGTTLRVRLDQAISTQRNLAGDSFSATLTDAVMVDGRQILPPGTRMDGHVLVAAHSGRLKGRARIVLALDSFQWEGRKYTIDTTASSSVSSSHRKRNTIAIGGGTGIGAAIGAIAGGGQGALIGAGIGAGAGTVGAVVTGRKQVTIPAETVLRFTLGAPVKV